MKLILGLCAGLAFSCASLRPASDRGVVLDDVALSELRFCSRSGPGNIERTWVPRERDVRRFEARLGTVHNLRATGCCFAGARIRDVDRYYRQYIGIVVDQVPLIYVNALGVHGEPEEWREVVVDVCDGGLSAWGVLYDPRTGYFWDLAVNGVA